MISRCPHCKTSERITSVTHRQTTIRCNDCGVQQTILLAPKDYFKPATDDRRLHPHHYVAVSLAFFCILGLLLLVKVVHALP